MASYDGNNTIFGLAVSIQHVPRASASQVASFFGVSGTQTVYGGTRGRSFMITGVLVGSDLAALAAVEALLLSYDDGIARVLVDTWGRSWPAVIFTGEYQPNPLGPRPLADGSGVALSYRAVFKGLV